MSFLMSLVVGLIVLALLFLITHLFQLEWLKTANYSVCRQSRQVFLFSSQGSTLRPRYRDGGHAFRRRALN
ncbi:hypothetical protein ABMB67_003069 [Halalkalibacter oceani]